MYGSIDSKLVSSTISKPCASLVVSGIDSYDRVGQVLIKAFDCSLTESGAVRYCPSPGGFVAECIAVVCITVAHCLHAASSLQTNQHVHSIYYYSSAVISRMFSGGSSFEVLNTLGTFEN